MRNDVSPSHGRRMLGDDRLPRKRVSAAALCAVSRQHGFARWICKMARCCRQTLFGCLMRGCPQTAGCCSRFGSPVVSWRTIGDANTVAVAGAVQADAHGSCLLADSCVFKEVATGRSGCSLRGQANAGQRRGLDQVDGTRAPVSSAVHPS
jgi:hypothetical protein